MVADLCSDKLEALPGYGIDPNRVTLLTLLRHRRRQCQAGAGRPAAIRHPRPTATATARSVLLTTASILSKRLVAALQALVLDGRA